MKRKITGLLPFVIAIAVIVAALKVLNWVPSLLQPGELKEYPSVQTARGDLNFKDLLVPSYFPQQILWPPSTVLAQTRPYPAIVMKFTRANRRDTALVISQSHGSALNIENPIEIAEVRETVRYSMKGRDAVLTVGVCRNDEPCSSIAWKEGPSTVDIRMKSAPFELIRIAESMVP